jgi:SAM-dependent methyltransferase
LELGCGGARWSLALSRRGARAVGLDLSWAQLAHARRETRRAGRTLPLVRANAERLPFASGTFDVVFCDWGAMTFADPRRTVPECARVLRPDGLLVFAAASPFSFVTWDRRKDRLGRTLQRDYFGQHRVEFGRNEPTEFRPTYGDWIALFRESGFAIERLVESRPPPGVESAYLPRRVSAWARRWPLECFWRLRKESPP